MCGSNKGLLLAVFLSTEILISYNFWYVMVDFIKVVIFKTT